MKWPFVSRSTFDQVVSSRNRIQRERDEYRELYRQHMRQRGAQLREARLAGYQEGLDTGRREARVELMGADIREHNAGQNQQAMHVKFRTVKTHLVALRRTIGAFADYIERNIIGNPRSSRDVVLNELDYIVGQVREAGCVNASSEPITIHPLPVDIEREISGEAAIHNGLIDGSPEAAAAAKIVPTPEGFQMAANAIAERLYPPEPDRGLLRSSSDEETVIRFPAGTTIEQHNVMSGPVRIQIEQPEDAELDRLADDGGRCADLESRRR